MVRLLALAILAVVPACPAIYSNQYDDRAGELEDHRVEFLPAENQVKRIGSGQKRVFWIDVARPSDNLVLHSQLPSNASSRIDYAPKLDDDVMANEIQPNEIGELHFGEQLWADCSFGRSFAYDAALPSKRLASTDMGADDCQVDGNVVYFLVGSTAIRKWVPPAEAVPLFDLRAEGGIDGQIAAFGVIGTMGIAVEDDGDVYKLDMTAKTATWLHQQVAVGGSAFFDEHGIVYDTSGGELRYIGYDDPANPTDRSITDEIADSGYHLNFKNGDIQTPQAQGDYAIHGRHLVYRGTRGIFAYGLDTHNVVDLLLDRGEGFEADFVYRGVSVASDGNGFLFVKNDNNGANSEDHQVYEVDLTDRLK